MMRLASNVAPYSEAAYIANVTEVFEHWRPWRKYGHLIGPETRHRRPLTAPWPDDPRSLGLPAVGR